MRPLRTFWCIQIVSTTFLDRNTKIQSRSMERMPKIRFLTHIFFSEQFRQYVASYVLYKCGDCGNFKLKMESLRPSGPKLRKISYTQNQKTGRGQKWVWPRQKKLKTGPVWFLRGQSTISRCQNVLLKQRQRNQNIDQLIPDYNELVANENALIEVKLRG